MNQRRTWPSVEAFVRAHPLYTPNRRGGKCVDCGQYVEPGRGNVVRAGRKSDPRTTYHIGHLPVVGVCPAHTVQP